jgi:hypothetical protein
MSYEFFSGLLQACYGWAESGGQLPFDEFRLNLPAVDGVGTERVLPHMRAQLTIRAGFDAEIIGVVFAAATDLVQEDKVASFRTEVRLSIDKILGALTLHSPAQQLFRVRSEQPSPAEWVWLRALVPKGSAFVCNFFMPLTTATGHGPTHQRAVLV